MAAPLPKILTANRLKDGDVLYWKAGTWILSITGADIFADAAAADTALGEAQKSVAANQVVAPYLFDVRVENGVVRPVKEREVIRAAGPTVRPDTGKQSQSHV